MSGPARPKGPSLRGPGAADVDLLSFSEHSLGPSSKGRDGLSTTVPLWQYQAALAGIQAAFVVGSVYLKSAMADVKKNETFNPVVYAFLREVSAGPLLFLLGRLVAGVVWPQRQDAWRVLAMGACLFVSQLCYIMGIDYSGVVVATCMQPAIPVFTAIMGIAMGLESAHPQKLVGIAMAVGGAVCMVMGGVSTPVHAGPNARPRGGSMLLGNVCLLANTLAMACYYVLSKSVVQRYPPICVAAWAYLVAAACMGGAAAGFTGAPDWRFPQSMVLPLGYWILVCSVLGYFTVTWAMRHLPASQVAAFQCLQPFVGTLLAYAVLHEEPSWWDLGALGVVAGLVLVTTDRRDVENSQALVGRMRRLLSTKSISKNLALLPLSGSLSMRVVGAGSPNKD